jgi:hypothetical protein
MPEPGLYRNVRRLSERARRRRSGGGDDGMPQWGGTAGEPGAPIGVPEDYTAPYVRDMTGMSARAGEGWAAGSGGHGSIHQRRPIYNEGDQWRPASLDPAGIGRLQASLAAAGLLTDFRYGVWDSASIKAYEELLGEANAAGITAEAAMRQRAAGIDFGGGSGGGRDGGGGGGGGHWGFDENGEPVFIPDQYVPPPLELKRTNRDDLIRAIRTGVIDTMGTGWSQQQVGELADLYLQREEQIQRDAYNRRIGLERTAFEQGESAVAGAVIEEPTMEEPETFLENELRRRDPVGVQAAGVVNDSMPAFIQALRGWG